MKIKISENLIKIINYVYKKTGKKIYVVGGYVRNSLMNIKTTDIDLCGEILAPELMELVTRMGFSAHTINKTLGTILIHAEHERFEYTTFRVESYSGTGAHTPNKVLFTTNLLKDANRRDFTVNAIYYNYIENEIIDPFNGVADINAKIIKAVQSPNKTFSDDALRILRFIRFVNELSFDWDKATYKSAKENVYKLKNLSKERILAEVKLIINADSKYQNNNQQKQVIKMFNRFNLYRYLFNNSFNNLKIKPKTKTYKAFVNSTFKTRYTAFIVLCMQAYLKGKTMQANISHLANTMLGASGLKDSSKNIGHIVKVYSFVQTLLYEKEIAKNKFLLNRLTVRLSEFDEFIKEYLKDINGNLIIILNQNLTKMKNNNMPFNVGELEITPKQLISLGVAEKQISNALNLLLNECLAENIKNNNKSLQTYVKNNFTGK